MYDNELIYYHLSFCNLQHFIFAVIDVSSQTQPHAVAYTLKIEEAILTNQITAYSMGYNWQAIPVQLDIGCLRNGSNMVFLRCVRVRRICNFLMEWNLSIGCLWDPGGCSV